MSADVHSLIGAYALDAIDDLERAAVDRHLRDCHDCRAEIAELREVAARLADGAWSVPPPQLRETVMAGIANTRQLPPEPAARPSATGPSRRMRLIAAAAALVAAAGTGSVVYAVQDHRVDQQRQLTEAAQASEARTRAVLAAPDLVVREQPLTSGGRVTVASSRLRDAGVIMLAASDAPADGRVYQLWTIRGGTPSSAGALHEGQSVIVQIVDGLPSSSEVGVTLEPAPGSATPTAPLEALVKLI
ncbi:anti-sigma factor [Actinoplanes sp. Pm04-4]|uniref:Regulator of SigK n=1 Tax=Paractinoplanes pyxinae TaxID=2997416 RepID=A0ABT4B515_9ACTN|nr:anti-sigma factor [Actinoplanes pyxinae]MCY1141587.1 anti-sigma factor [Actinoplanes pyxinae]